MHQDFEMKPFYFRILKTIAFAPSWYAFIFIGLGYLFPGTWAGTTWGEIVLFLVAVATIWVIYWGLAISDQKK